MSAQYFEFFVHPSSDEATPAAGSSLTTPPSTVQRTDSEGEVSFAWGYQS